MDSIDYNTNIKKLLLTKILDFSLFHIVMANFTHLLINFEIFEHYS